MSYSSEAVKRWRKNCKEKMIASMGESCQCCSYNTCTSALAFHHLDPSKKDIVFGVVRASPKKWEVLVQELRKCILVCHNCHSEIHAGIRQVPATFATFDENYADWRKIEELDICPVCKEDKPARQRFCSHKCAATNRRKVDWESVDLLTLLKNHKISELEDMLGISNAAIYKRRDKIIKEQKKDVDNL